MAMCTSWRVSETVGDAPTRKFLGKPTEQNCQQISKEWLPRLAAMVEAKRGSDVLAAFPEICRDVGQEMAGRMVEIVWCSSWNQVRGGRAIFVPGPPDEVWNVLDGSPLEGIGVKKSSRDELLRQVFEHRIGKDWDQIRVKTDMELIGFICGVWNRRWELDPLITSTTPQFSCMGNVSEIVGAPSKPLFMFGLQINVSVKFSESGEPRGWQQIEVKTGEAHL